MATDGLWINAVAPKNGGGAIVAGTVAGEWVVGEINGRGQVDPAFGDGGWAVLPFRGELTAVVQAPSGRIVIAGDNGGGGCCTLNWAAALSPRGQLERRFGSHGRTELPTGEDSGVQALALEPNGDILASVGYGLMGCWGVAVSTLTPSGRPLPLFGKRLARFWDRARLRHLRRGRLHRRRRLRRGRHGTDTVCLGTVVLRTVSHGCDRALPCGRRARRPHE